MEYAAAKLFDSDHIWCLAPPATQEEMDMLLKAADRTECERDLVPTQVEKV